MLLTCQAPFLLSQPLLITHSRSLSDHFGLRHESHTSPWQGMLKRVEFAYFHFALKAFSRLQSFFPCARACVCVCAHARVRVCACVHCIKWNREVKEILNSFWMNWVCIYDNVNLASSCRLMVSALLDVINKYEGLDVEPDICWPYNLTDLTGNKMSLYVVLNLCLVFTIIFVTGLSYHSRELLFPITALIN